jgi:hypothetical protein
VLTALARLQRSLSALRDALKDEDLARLTRLLSEAKRNREAGGNDDALGS